MLEKIKGMLSFSVSMNKCELFFTFLHSQCFLISFLNSSKFMLLYACARAYPGRDQCAVSISSFFIFSTFSSTITLQPDESFFRSTQLNMYAKISDNVNSAYFDKTSVNLSIVCQRARLLLKIYNLDTRYHTGSLLVLYDMICMVQYAPPIPK